MMYSSIINTVGSLSLSLYALLHVYLVSLLLQLIIIQYKPLFTETSRQQVDRITDIYKENTKEWLND